MRAQRASEQGAQLMVGSTCRFHQTDLVKSGTAVCSNLPVIDGQADQLRVSLGEGCGSLWLTKAGAESAREAERREISSFGVRRSCTFFRRGESTVNRRANRQKSDWLPPWWRPGWTQRLKPGRWCDRSGCRKMHPGIGWRHLSKSRVQESVPVAMVMHTHTLRLLALTEQ